ncbi:MAG: 4-hydroxy-3-methylbut-2-enyl diphosphate reductase [Erysipelotrichia bacterium]|nr:4-hydroxy-3-methylbut-2-enyl diphosphate reductase [Erysipelotrichia bacterium]
MIELLKPIGHCFGVINAINVTKKIVKQYPKQKIYVFGLLVHNEEVTKELDSLGVVTIDLTGVDPIKRLKEFKPDEIVIFTAHGHPNIYETILKENGVTFIDATCSRVKKTFATIKEADHVIYIGKNHHPEAMAALTMNDNVYFYDIKQPFDYSVVRSKTPLVINQTTLSFLELEAIHKEIKSHFPKANIVDEICNATLLRQQALKALPNTVDTIVVVGSKKSSNTMKLFELAHSIHSNKQIYLWENVNDCQTSELTFKHVVIASGTSTPMSTINQIKACLERKKEDGR